MSRSESQSVRVEGPTLPGGPFLLVLVAAGIQIIGTNFAALGQPEARTLDALAILLLAAGPVALLARSRWPVGVLFFVLAVTVAYFLLDYPRGPIFIALIVAFVTAVMRGHRAAAVTSLVVGFVAFGWGGYWVGVEEAPGLGKALGVGAWLLLLLTAAEVARTKLERTREAARTRAEEAKRRASEERLRIARELHDVLAHNISLINVQAGVALHLMDQRPEQARTALSAIKQASNETLGELRSVLDVLRQGNERPPRSPTSGLGHLEDLTARAEAAGLRVTKRVDGTPRSLPPGVDLAAFRIVQEALTNVTRHAGRAHALVRIDYGEHDLTVQVEDDGRGGHRSGTTRGAGRGIPGMQERAAAVGGELEAGPLPGGGFRVRARLPLDGDGAEEQA